MRSGAFDIPGNGERVMLAVTADPAERSRAYVTSFGGQSSFIGMGDMYATALRYASYLTDGALVYVQRDGTVYAPPIGGWEPRREVVK